MLPIVPARLELILLEPILLLCLLFVSAGFSGTETALFSLPESDLAKMRTGVDKGGRRVANLLERPARLLAALLIGNLLVNTIASVLATSLLIRRLGPSGLVVAVPVMTVVILFAGEITPKLVALRYPHRLALIARLPVTVWLTLNRPLLHLIDRAGEGLLSRLSLERTGSRPLSTQELVTATGLAVQDASLTETEGRFVSRLLQLEDLDVRDIMTPRTDAVTIGVDDTRARILERAARRGHNRYPVMDGEAQRPSGVCHVKDLLTDDGEGAPAHRLQRAPIFVPESKSVAELLNEFRLGGQHMAFVVDEHGDFTGLVTLEDCIEALTGPWRDESDTHASDLLPVADHNWIVSGGADLRRVNETCGTRIPSSHIYVTLAGYVMDLRGDIPNRGDRIVEDGFRYTVLEIDGHRLVRVRVQRLDEESGRGGAS